MQIRSAKPEDALAVARVHVRSWQVGYRDLLPNDYLDRLRPEERAQKYDFANDDPAKPKTIVGIEGDRIVGFATVAPAKDPDLTHCGELCALYVDPDNWKSGFGAALLHEAQRRLVALGFRNAALWVLAGNVRAERFYRQHGWIADGQRRSDVVWNVSVDEIRYRQSLMG